MYTLNGLTWPLTLSSIPPVSSAKTGRIVMELMDEFGDLWRRVVRR